MAPIDPENTRHGSSRNVQNIFARRVTMGFSAAVRDKDEAVIAAGIDIAR